MSAPGRTTESPPGADWLDRALADSARDHAAVYLDDDGFTARVMQALPAPVAPPAWRKPALGLLWGIAGVGVAALVPGLAQDVAHQAVRLVAAKPFALSEIAALLALCGAGMWSAAYFTLKA